MASLIWTRETRPDWDGTGTVAESWTAEVGRYVIRVDRFVDEQGWAYTVTRDGNPLRAAENESAESFEDAEERTIAVLPQLERLTIDYVGREWPCELTGDWNGYYPVVAGGRIVAVYDAANQDPREYADRPIVADTYIDGDAPDDIADGLYDTAQAAKALGISRDRVIDLCNAGRMGRKLGGVWIIEGYELRANQVRGAGRPKRFALHDWETGEDVLCPIRREQALTEGAVLLHMQPPGMSIVAVVAFEDGTQFTPRDWQGEQPASPADIEQWEWVDEHGQDAVMLSGLPRRFPA